MTTMGYPMQHEGEHIWLRQSVTLTVDGQTRTLEMAVPVRPGATADEIESLLDEADAGMRRLSRHLDSQIASLSNTATLPDQYATSAISANNSNHSTPTTSPPAASTPAVPAATQLLPTPPVTPVATDVEEELDLPAVVEPPRPAPKAPATPPVAPVTPAASAVTAPASATPASTPRTPAPTPVAATDMTPLTVKDFIAAAQTELNLTPKQAMDQLNVKSLAGLNLREALEVLRRQALRGSEPPASTAPVAPQSAASRPSAPPTSTPAATATPRYFEEEDSEFDLSFKEANDEPLEDPLPEDEEEFDDEDEEDRSATGTASYGAGMADDDDPFDLEDVPDFGLPPVTTPVPAPQRRTPSAAAPRSAEMPETPAPAQGAHNDPRTHALQIIGQMRGTSSSGASTSQQRTAYQNIIIRELGEPEAKALVQGLWRISAERLGAEQFDVLLSWGKRDTFAEEATLVLAALRAERARNAQTTPTTPPPTDANANQNRPARPAPASAAPPAAPPARNNARPAAPRSRQSARSSVSEDE